MPETRILIIEEDLSLAGELRHAIAELGYPLDYERSAENGSIKALEDSYALVICDAALGGYEICRILRSHKNPTPLLLLTSPSDIADEVAALELGADDYLIKPYSVRELTARVRALFRRAGMEARALEEQQSGNGDVRRFDGLCINLTTRNVLCGETSVNLTVTEYQILALLTSAPGRPFSREQLVEHLWGHPQHDCAQTIMTHVSRLRAKLEPNPEHPIFIETIRGLGYRFSASPVSE